MRAIVLERARVGEHAGPPLPDPVTPPPSPVAYSGAAACTNAR